MRLRCLFCLMLGLDVVRVSEMRVMSGFFVLALVEKLGRLTMMFSCLRVMVGGLGMVFGGALGVRHHSSPRNAPQSVRIEYARIG